MGKGQAPRMGAELAFTQFFPWHPILIIAVCNLRAGFWDGKPRKVEIAGANPGARGPRGAKAIEGHDSIGSQACPRP